MICVAIPWKHRMIFTCQKWGVVFPPESWGMERNVICTITRLLRGWVKDWLARLVDTPLNMYYDVNVLNKEHCPLTCITM